MRNWWQSIREHTEQIKGYAENIPQEVFIVLVVFLVGVASFGLGRLSVIENNRTPVTVRIAPASERKSMYLGGEIVASKNGKKYRFPWCSGVSSMKESNKIWFKTTASARAAGYTPAKNCKGLP